MSKCRMLCRLGLILSFALVAEARAGTVDPLLRSLQQQRQEKTAAAGIAYGRLIAIEETDKAADPTVGVIVELEPGATEPAGVAGMVVGSRHGIWATARLPLGAVDDLAGLPGVRHVHAARMQQAAMDRAVPFSGVDDVWYGAPAYTGEGVLIGVIDSGIDLQHPDFIRSEGGTRVVAAWDQYTTGTAPAGFDYGAEDTAADIDAGISTQRDNNGHGTHVAGIAAGNGRASSGQYAGVAYGSEILIAKSWRDVEGGFPEDKTMDAMNYLVQKAATLGKPIVVNMSLGGHMGAHDGSRPQEQLLNQLTGQGVVFCVAAGNEGASSIHDTTSAAGGSVTYRIGDYDPNPGTQDDYALITFWVDGAGSPSVTVSGGGMTFGPIAGGVVDGVTGAGGTVAVDNAGGGADPINGDKLILIQWDDREGTTPVPDDWTITLDGGVGTAHVWNITSSMASSLPDSDQRYSLSMPGTAENAVTVAAVKSRYTWPAQAGEVGYSGTWGALEVGDRALFSSVGPTRDAREKPDLAAPGMAIVSAYSRDSDPPASVNMRVGTEYVASQGTSMAAPYVSGVAALMLEKNPLLTGTEIRAILRETAAADSWTGATWNEYFGAGKLDAPAALAAVDASAGSAGGDIDDDGSVTVLDVVLLINHILDPSGHPLDAGERASADVYPVESGNGVLDAQDLARLVSLVLGESGSAPFDGSSVATVLAGAPFKDAAGRWLPVTVTGEAVRAGQFRVRLDGGDWDAGPLAIRRSGGASVQARVVGDAVRLVFYGDDPGSFGAGLRFDIPLPESGTASLGDVLVAGPNGAELEVSLTSPAPRLSLAVWPNPATARTTVRFAAPGGGRNALSVFDLRGRKVRTLSVSDGADDAGTAEWDGRDADGRDLAPGVYMIRLESEMGTATRKVVLRR